MGFPGQSTSKDGGHPLVAPRRHDLLNRRGGSLKHNLCLPHALENQGRQYCLGSTTTAPATSKAEIRFGSPAVIEQDGTIHWSEPEILLYDDDLKILGHELSRPHPAGWQVLGDRDAEDDRPGPPHRSNAAGRDVESMVTTVAVAERGTRESRLEGECACGRRRRAMPKLPQLDGRRNLARFPGPFRRPVAPDRYCWTGGIRPARAASVITTAQQTPPASNSATARSSMPPGTAIRSFSSPARTHHITIIVDGGPRIITFLVDGQVCDGGTQRTLRLGTVRQGLGGRQRRPVADRPVA